MQFNADMQYVSRSEAGQSKRRVARTERAQSAPGDCGALTRKALVMNDMIVKGKLVRAEDMLEQVFAQNCKPSLRWLRTQTKTKAIPHIRIGHLVFFDVEMVRASLAGKRLIRGRTLAPAAPAAPQAA